MPQREKIEPLVNCLAIPCPWQSCYRTCSFRLAQRGQNGFPMALCTFYSTPGPHAPSRIAKATGLTIDSVNRTIEVVHAKMRRMVIASGELRFDPTISNIVEDHLEEISA